MKKTTVNHWRFENGQAGYTPTARSIIDEYVTPRGWYCWVYPADDAEFETWMQQNCPGAECTHRFNSGDPMYTVYIPDDAEAMLFKLRW
jgi:hypothetical protein